jgi:hypothetical protein
MLWPWQPMPWPWQALAAMALPGQHMPWPWQPIPWPWHAMAALVLPWQHMAWHGQPTLAVACLGLSSPCLGRGMPWQPWQCLGSTCLILGSHGIALAAHSSPCLSRGMPWHCLGSTCLSLGRGSLLKTTQNHEKRLAGMALAAQGSWQHAMLHAACPKRAFSPSHKIGLCHFRF